jgi:hypothetical protein
MALALDKEERPPSANLLAEAISNGARGIEPAQSARTGSLGGTAATRVLSDRAPTGQTQVAPRTRAGETTGRNAPARPRQLEPRRPAYPPSYGPPATERVAAERPGGSRAVRRFFAFLAIVLLFVAAVAAAVTISASTSNNVVHFRKVVARDTSDAVQQFQNLINQYTK